MSTSGRLRIKSAYSIVQVAFGGARRVPCVEATRWLVVEAVTIHRLDNPEVRKAGRPLHTAVVHQREAEAMVYDRMYMLPVGGA